ncbi:DUF4114 domain-containing protein [Marivirga sp. S37H4]|uniref:DUF4114 domain-containing protein n=1 Tax=Marivirga aurantiaca TaxID=2802615 RepID=A0A934WYJ7_9BACT|nr:DUF4114 domain-containing protein [Marivirga aurantiaca]MBK6265281.1 DUF4114 domain-containing protein [Marivirga aurantiaca]
MKSITFNLLFIGFLVCLFSCEEEEIITETPDDIVPTVIKDEVLQEIERMFPEKENFRAGHPELFEVSAEKNILLSKESEIYLTFVSEGAGFKNSLGFYTYQKGNEPSDPSALDLQILFPNVSDDILNQGDMLQLGKGTFPAGTVVGFFLIKKGWSGEVNYDNETFYTDIDFNTETQQHVLFKLEEFDEIILAFEDKMPSENSDLDYNDIIFTISDNRDQNITDSFDLRKVVEY